MKSSKLAIYPITFDIIFRMSAANRKATFYYYYYYHHYYRKTTDNHTGNYIDIPNCHLEQIVKVFGIWTCMYAYPLHVRRLYFVLSISQIKSNKLIKKVSFYWMTHVLINFFCNGYSYVISPQLTVKSLRIV